MNRTQRRANGLTQKATERRNDRMQGMRQRGWKVADIAERFGITGSRVSQILSRPTRKRRKAA